MPKLSAIVITKNSAKKIGRTLESINFADEVIVIVDSTTNDNTAEIAQGMGAQVFYEDWQGYGKQKNIGLAKASSEWVLFIDDDEEVPQALAQEIKKAINDPVNNIYWVRIVTHFLNKPLQHLYGHNPRLFKKNAAQWTDTHVHEQLVTTDGVIIKLTKDAPNIILKPILHYSHDSIGSYLKKMHRYTTLDAREMLRTKQHRSGKRAQPTFLLPYKLALKQLLKLLFYKRGILDGFAGIVWSFLSAYYELEMGHKYLSFTKNN